MWLLPVYPSIHPSIHPCLHSSVHLSIHPSNHLSILSVPTFFSSSFSSFLPCFPPTYPSSWASQVLANAGDKRDVGSITGSGRFPWRRPWRLTPVFLPGESHGQRSLAGYSPWGHNESHMTETAQHSTQHVFQTHSFIPLHPTASPIRLPSLPRKFSSLLLLYPPSHLKIDISNLYHVHTEEIFIF